MREKLQDWFRAQLKPGATLADDSPYFARWAGKNQVMWLRDSLRMAFGLYSDEWDAVLSVVGQHHSRSVCLPVCEVKIPGLTLLFRCNFYNWVLTVESDKPTDIGGWDLFSEEARADSSCCDGFDKDRVHGPYKDNPARFTCYPYSQEALWMICRVLARPSC